LLLDDFLIEYYPRSQTLSAIWSWVRARPQGLLSLRGDLGCGKSWVLRGLAVNAHEYGYIPILLEQSEEESFTVLLWRLLDATEFLLEIEGEFLRMTVAHALYQSGPAHAFLAYLSWLSGELQGNFLVLLDGVRGPLDAGFLSSPSQYPDGVYVIATGLRSQESDEFDVNPVAPVHVTELQGFLKKRLSKPGSKQVKKIVDLSQGSWRMASYYTKLIASGYTAPLPPPEELYQTLFERLAERVGEDVFRRVHLEILILLAVAQVPVNSDLLRSWGLPQQALEFALFELRDFLNTDGEGSQLEALFTGEHYSLQSRDLGEFIRNKPAWRDRIDEAHRRVVSPSLNLRDAHWSQSMGSDGEYYALCFLEHHLQASGRSADLARVSEDLLYVERCWGFSRLAREQGYDEIATQLILIAATKLSFSKIDQGPQALRRLADVQAECSNLLTQLGRYADAAVWAEKSLDQIKNEDSTREAEARDLRVQCLLCLADPYLLMGMVEQANHLFEEALAMLRTDDRSDQSKTIHALRGLARSLRAVGKIREALVRGEEAIRLARDLTAAEGEEWANFLFDVLLEQGDYLRVLADEDQEPRGPLEIMALRWETLRNLREAGALYEKFDWPVDVELATLYLEESTILFELEKWSEAEERLSRALKIYRDLPDIQPGEVASLDYLRSQALTLMNRIGEASITLNRLMTPEILDNLELSERALVMFFRAKVLSHQGHLSAADSQLQEAISLYRKAVAQGTEDLRLELVSAKVYQARVAARRGRLERAMTLCRQAARSIASMTDEDEPPFLEVADLRELEAWILLHRRQYRLALARSDVAIWALEQVSSNDNEVDVETERSVTLATRALILAGQKDYPAALAACERSIEIETRRSQEGYDSATMWLALHMGSKVRILREGFGVERADEAVSVCEKALTMLEGLPANQQFHIGPYVASLSHELAQALLLDGRKEMALTVSERVLKILEAEMRQDKEYLVAALVDAARTWLTCQVALSAQDPQRLFLALSRFFGSWSSWSRFLELEQDSVFLAQAERKLTMWLNKQGEPLITHWLDHAPADLRTLLVHANVGARRRPEEPDAV
jgi:tetratricopeptide (TPR) repeat protein